MEACRGRGAPPLRVHRDLRGKCRHTDGGARVGRRSHARWQRSLGWTCTGGGSVQANPAVVRLSEMRRVSHCSPHGITHAISPRRAMSWHLRASRKRWSLHHHLSSDAVWNCKPSSGRSRLGRGQSLSEYVRCCAPHRPRGTHTWSLVPSCVVRCFWEPCRACGRSFSERSWPLSSRLCSRRLHGSGPNGHWQSWTLPPGNRPH